MSNIKYDFDVEATIKRIGEIINSPKNIDIADSLNISGQVVSNWKYRNHVPWQALFIFSRERNIFFEWLITGEGQKNKEDEKKLISILESKLSKEEELTSVCKENANLYKKQVVLLEENVVSQKQKIKSKDQEIKKLKNEISSLKPENNDSGRKKSNAKERAA